MLYSVYVNRIITKKNERQLMANTRYNILCHSLRFVKELRNTRTHSYNNNNNDNTVKRTKNPWVHKSGRKFECRFEQGNPHAILNTAL